MLRWKASLGGLLLLAGTGAQALVVSYDATEIQFSTTGQSMWGSGNAGTLDKTEFVGLSWNETSQVNAIVGEERSRVIGTGGTIPNPARPAWDAAWALCRAAYSSSTCRNGGTKILGVQIPPPLGSRPPATIPNPISAQYVDTRTGAAGSANTSGRVGFEMALEANSGSVDSSLDYQLTLDLPDQVAAGEYVQIQGTAELVSAALDTAFPTLQASLSLVTEASASFTGTGCFALAGCSNTNVSTGLLGGTVELVSLNHNGEGTIEYFDGDPILNALLFQNAAPPTGLPATVASPIAEITAHLPQPDATGGLTADGRVRASGQDDLLDIFLDVDNLVSLGLTGQPNLFGGELELGALGTVEFNLLNVLMGPTLDLLQTFEYTPNLYMDLNFSRPVDVLGVGQVDQIRNVTPDLLPQLAFDDGETWISPTLFLGYEKGNEVLRGVELKNELLLDVDGTLKVSILEATASLLNTFDFDLGIGEIFNDSLDLFTSPAVFNSLFGLEGFNDVALNPFRVATEGFVRAVPEPGSLALMILGLMALVSTRRLGVFAERHRAAA